MSDDKDAAPIAVGDVVAGKYRVERVLGEGGMGTVVAATHLDLDELRALKFVLPSMSENQEVFGRFLREARAVAKIDSEHVAKIHDIGRLDDGAPYLVMEYLEGEDLKALLEREGALEAEVAVRFALQALVGLADAHARKIIHRDLKPPNLFIAESSDGVPRVKVLDFGVSKLVGHDVPELDKTRTNVMLGSPYYMSPEQMESTKEVDARSDIWSMGVVLYEMLAGEVPFDGPSITALTIKVVQQDPAPLGGFRDDLPDGLEAVVMRCLEKKPADRYATVAALAEALEPFADGGDLAARAARILSRADDAELGEPLVEEERRADRPPGGGRSSMPTRVVTGSRKSSASRKSNAEPTSRPVRRKARRKKSSSEKKRLDGTKTASSWAAPGAEPNVGRRYLLIGTALGAVVATIALVAYRGDAPPDVTAPVGPAAASSPRQSAAPENGQARTRTDPVEPTTEPSAEPTTEPSAEPTAEPSASASAVPTAPRPGRRREDIYRGVDDDPYADYEKKQRQKAPDSPFH
jgi:eukaryotic-like serine/threonine-protein kinase